jgi:hypothetical protein
MDKIDNDILNQIKKDLYKEKNQNQENSSNQNYSNNNENNQENSSNQNQENNSNFDSGSKKKLSKIIGIIILLLVGIGIIYLVFFTSTFNLNNNIDITSDQNTLLDVNIENDSYQNNIDSNNSLDSNQIIENNFSDEKLNNMFLAIDNNCSNYEFRMDLNGIVNMPLMGMDMYTHYNIGMEIKGVDQNNTNNCQVILTYYLTEYRFTDEVLTAIEEETGSKLTEEEITAQEDAMYLEDLNGIYSLDCYYDKQILKNHLRIYDENSSDFLNILMSSSSTGNTAIEGNEVSSESVIKGNGYICYYSDIQDYNFS